ncbi:MAG: hypothetical protein BWY50_01907 [Spirochaetes bacterium ADurb.Bin315]|nr:MAG: hypothetical protein BWY50_01907 [Spirochaetes bacterium ADurb.Bin315]
MDSSILNKALKRNTRDLLAHRIEAGDNHCFRGVVNDYIDPGEGLKGSDIPSLASDDPSFHLIGRKAHRTDGNIIHDLGRQPLDRGNDDFPGFFVGGELCLLLNLVDHELGVSFRIVVQALHDKGFRLIRRQSSDAFKFHNQVAFPFGNFFFLLGKIYFPLSQLFFNTIQISLLLLEILLFLKESSL